METRTLTMSKDEGSGGSEVGDYMRPVSVGCTAGGEIEI